MTNGNVLVTDITTKGTTLAALSDPQAPGFNKTEIIDPAKNPPGRHGAVSAVVLSLTAPIFLPAVGTDSVLDLDIKASKGQTAAPLVGTLTFVDNLKGSGQPVQNAVTVNGNTETPC